MDVSVLSGEILKNTIRSVVIDDCLATNAFRSTDAVLIGGALRNNVSVVTLTLRRLVLKDIAIEGILAALSRHVAIRSVAMQGMELTAAVGQAILELVRVNPRIVHVDVEHCGLTASVLDDIDAAVRYNLLSAPDPQFNPFDNILVTAAETWKTVQAVKAAHREYREKRRAREKKRNSELAASSATDDGAAATASPVDPPTKAAAAPMVVAVTEQGDVIEVDRTDDFQTDSDASSAIGDDDLVEEALGALGRGVCGRFLEGRCRFGSRCALYHPDVMVGLPPAIAEQVASSKAASDLPAPKLSKKSARKARLNAAKAKLLDPSIGEWFAEAVTAYSDKVEEKAKRAAIAAAEALSATTGSDPSVAAAEGAATRVASTTTVGPSQAAQSAAAPGAGSSPTPASLESTRTPGKPSLLDASLVSDGVVMELAPVIVASVCFTLILFRLSTILSAPLA